MRFLLSLPPNLVGCFHTLTGFDPAVWFCASDPEGSHLGSGGGTVNLVREEIIENREKVGERKCIIHAGGCSRRVPAYAPSGKVLIPLPDGQMLLERQVALCKRVMEKAPQSLTTMIVSGDVLVQDMESSKVREFESLKVGSEAPDVVCLGMRAKPALMKNHGVFVVGSKALQLDFMLQKPSEERLAELEKTHTLLMDIGIWLLSDRAMERLTTLSTNARGEVHFYDLYGSYGLGLGVNPTKPEPLLEDLSVAIVPLEGGRFLHFGTSRELLSSAAELDGRSTVDGQRFIFNARCEAKIGETAADVWVENSCLSDRWTLTSRNMVTGIPANAWTVTLGEGQCVDMAPVGDAEYVLRPYSFNDKFSGAVDEPPTLYMEQRMADWMAKRCIAMSDLTKTADIQDADLFPVSSDMGLLGQLLHWFLDEEPDKDVTELWRRCRRLSANAISREANMSRLFQQRALYSAGRAGMDKAFAALRDGLVGGMLCTKSVPRMTVHEDQIVCGQCPVRADVAGGWTDTPPYSVYEGGKVVNFAFNINGQAPLHVFVRPNKGYNIVCRSIDLGMSEKITTYEELESFDRVGSPFSIPKAALALAGLLPHFCGETYGSLRSQLEAMGCGIDIVMLAAVPAGSGLGTSSILAATVLGALSDFCGLGWSEQEVCRRTLVLEQLLTTGGGWQDQYGGVWGGVKMLQSVPGFNQQIGVDSLPDSIFQGERAECHMMYYTGITRTAKHILVDIVKGMFLKEEERLAILREMKEHAENMRHAIENGDMADYGRLLRHSWELNCRLDSGTNPAKVQELCNRIDDLCLGYKLLGAGGGGYMYMVAKDPAAAARVRRELKDNPLCTTSRVVDMSISSVGLHISRS